MSILIRAAAMEKGQAGVVNQVCAERSVNRRLRDMGVRPGAPIRSEGKAPLGDPLEFEVMGYRLALRRSEADAITVEVVG